MIPRVNNPEGIQTADYLFRGEYWDLKEIEGSGKRTIDTAIKKKRNQSCNFIIDISKSKLTNNDAFQQLISIYNNKDRFWVDKILLKKNSKLIKVFKRKKETNHQSSKRTKTNLIN